MWQHSSHWVKIPIIRINFTPKLSYQSGYKINTTIFKKEFQIGIAKAKQTFWKKVRSDTTEVKQNPFFWFQTLSPEGQFGTTGVNVVLESHASLTAVTQGSLPSMTRSQRNPTPEPPHPVARQLGIPDPKPGTAVKGLSWQVVAPEPPHPVARQLGIPDPKPGTAVKGQSWQASFRERSRTNP